MQGIPQGQQNNTGAQGGQGGSQKPSLSWQTPPAAPKAAPAAAEKPKAPAPAPKPADKNAAEKSNMATYVGIFVAGLIIGVLLGWGIVSSRSGATSNATSTAQGTDTSGASVNTGTATIGAGASSGDVTVDASQPAGSSVAVSSVSVSKPTWIVVYDNNDGTPGRALGATLFLPSSAGGETSGTIDLLRPTVAGTSYLVGQLVDNGDYNLSFSQDTVVSDSSGKPALILLTAK